MRNKKILITSTILSVLCIACIFTSFAHSGRTDSSGGHWNKSTGTYHYHCGGYPAHSHSGGVCPYKTPKSYSSSTSSFTKYDEGYEEGYEDGHIDGRSEGYDEGYDKGYDEGYDVAYDKGYNARVEEATAEREKEITILMIFGVVILIIVAIVKFIKQRNKE